MARGDKIIVALDVSRMDEAERLVNILRPLIRIYKIGSELFTSCGVRAVDLVRRKGCKVFLDLKYHDIPNTVVRAVKAATARNVHMITLHTMGGLAMMRDVMKAAKEESARLSTPRPLVLGVTVLTSMNTKDLGTVGIKSTAEKEVMKLAALAEKAGLDGIIASPKEITAIRRRVKNNFLIVTPGIRPLGSQKKDQKRVATPRQALEDGADYLVIGRPITACHDPRACAEKILNEIHHD